MATVTIDGSATGLVSSLNESARAAGAVQAAFKQGADESRKFARFAKQALEETLSPSQRLNRSIEGLNRAQRKGAINAQQFAAGFDKLNREFRESQVIGGDIQNTTASWRTGLVGVVAGYFSVQAAISAVTSALQEQEEIQKRVNRVSGTVASGQLEVLQSFGVALGIDGTQAFLERIRNERDTRITEAQSLEAIAQIGSATNASLSNQERQDVSLRVLNAVTALAFNTPDQIGNLGGAVIDIQQLTGLSEAEALGNILAVRDQARATSTEEATKAVRGAAIAAAQAGGDDLENVFRAEALFAALGNQIAEQGGSLPSTAVAGFISTVVQFAKKELGTDEVTLEQAIDLARATEGKTREKLLKSFPGRQITKPLIQSLLDPSSRFSEDADQVLEALRSGTETGAEIAEGAGTLTPEISRLQFERRGQSLTEGTALRNQQAADIAATRALLFGDEEGNLGFFPSIARNDAGGIFDGLRRRLSRFEFNNAILTGADPFDAALDTLGTFEADLQLRGVTEAEQRMINEMQGTRQLLQEQRDLSQRQSSPLLTPETDE